MNDREGAPPRALARGAALRVACAALGALLGCASTPPPPLPTGEAPAPRASASTKPPPTASAGPVPPAVDPPDPEAERFFRAHLREPAAALSPAPSPPPRVVALALANSARDHTYGMKPDAELSMAQLAEGKRASMPVTLPPGECTTFLAQGGLGTIEIDLFLTTGSGDDLRILGEDPSVGPIAVVGGHGRCFSSATAAAISAELHLIMRRGGGAVLVRRYRR